MIAPLAPNFKRRALTHAAHMHHVCANGAGAARKIPDMVKFATSPRQ
jgi:hypothetical protein